MNIKYIHQIEVSSICNLKCPYCLHSTENFKRPKVFMNDETLINTLELLERFIWDHPEKQDINLSGVGETFAHPKIAKIINGVRNIIGPKRRIIIPTNALLLDEDILNQIEKANPRIYVSLHKPDAQKYIIERIASHGLLEGTTNDPVDNPNDWARQVNHTKPRYTFYCPWKTHGMGFITANGDILQCYLDGDNSSKMTNVNLYRAENYNPELLEVKSFKLCSTCYQK